MVREQGLNDFSSLKCRAGSVCISGPHVLEKNMAVSVDTHRHLPRNTHWPRPWGTREPHCWPLPPLVPVPTVPCFMHLKTTLRTASKVIIFLVFFNPLGKKSIPQLFMRLTLSFLSGFQFFLVLPGPSRCSCVLWI